MSVTRALPLTTKLTCPAGAGSYDAGKAYMPAGRVQRMTRRASTPELDHRFLDAAGSRAPELPGLLPADARFHTSRREVQFRISGSSG
jgi:hypothetical protein